MSRSANGQRVSRGAILKQQTNRQTQTPKGKSKGQRQMNMYQLLKERECTDSSRIEAFEVTFDKELVDALLKINVKNRPTVKRNVEYFERKIQENAWARGAFIVTVNRSFTWMIDAQHHIIAIKNKGYPSVRGVVRIIPDDIAEETFSAMDCGSPRGLATMLGVAGVVNYAPISSMLKDYVRIGVGFTQKMTPDEAIDMIEDLKDVIKEIPITRAFVGRGNKGEKRIPSWICGTFLKVLSHDISRKDFVSAFFAEMLSGDYSTGSALHGPRAIRDAVLDGDFDGAVNSSRILLLKAFDAYSNGKDLNHLWRRIEMNDGVYLGMKYFGKKIDVANDKKHGGKKKSHKAK